MNILGVSSGHDANICVLRDGEVILHVEKERLTRKRYDTGSMEDVLPELLADMGMTIGDIDLVATSIPVWTHIPRTGVVVGGEYSDEMGYGEGRITLCGRTLPAIQVAHHLGHSAYAFYLSPFDDADILSLDAGGNFTYGLVSHGQETDIALLCHLDRQRLGDLWCALAMRLFNNMFAAGKVMGLAPFGQSRYVREIRDAYGVQGEHGHQVIRLAQFPDWDSIPSFPGLPEINTRGPLTQADADAAASLQEITNQMAIQYLEAFQTAGCRHLCLTGGVVLNCVMNESLRLSGLYDHVFVPPAPNDAGLSMGFSLFVWHGLMKKPRRRAAFRTPFLGRPYSRERIESVIRNAQDLGFWVTHHQDRSNLDAHVADLLSGGEVVAAHQGCSESGPRALGHRSILADPRQADVRDRLNLRIKFREPFRPFAPSVLKHKAATEFAFSAQSPYMSFAPVAPVQTRTMMPATTHVDGSARVQTVEQDHIPELWGILAQFEHARGYRAC